MRLSTQFLFPLALSLPLLAAEAIPAKRAVPRLTVSRRIDMLLSTKEARSARWGIQAFSLKTGRLAYQRNQDEHFTPASNTKLFSTALALARLGPDYRFTTRIQADTRLGPDGRLLGDLRLIGGGDPTLSGRSYPYTKDDPGRPPTEPLEQLVDDLVRQGLREVTGDIVGDDRAYLHAPYPEGWTVDDSIWEYGAPVSALPFNDNAFALSIWPGTAPGDPAQLTVNPPSLPVLIDNRIVTSANGRARIDIDRAPGSRQIRIAGSIPLGNRSVRQLLAVDDAAYYAAHVLRDALTRKGVVVHGSVVTRHRTTVDEPFDDSGVELARRTSVPLTEIARVVDKVSQNLHAEILLREVARVRANTGSREAGLKEMDAFLSEIGIQPEEYHFEDGSGLSRRTLVSPAALIKLLTHMDKSAHREAWDSLLPIGGEDGTLARRFDQSPQAKVIHAKTGTLATANALSGYITTRRGVRMVFSIIANNYTAPPAEIRKVIDRISLALTEWEGN